MLFASLLSNQFYKMKNLLIVVIFFSSIFISIAQDNEINWMSLEDAVEAQNKEPVKLLWTCTLPGADLVNY